MGVVSLGVAPLSLPPRHPLAQTVASVEVLRVRGPQLLWARLPHVITRPSCLPPTWRRRLIGKEQRPALRTPRRMMYKYDAPVPFAFPMTCASSSNPGYIHIIVILLNALWKVSPGPAPPGSYRLQIRNAPADRTLPPASSPTSDAAEMVVTPHPISRSVKLKSASTCSVAGLHRLREAGPSSTPSLVSDAYSPSIRKASLAALAVGAVLEAEYSREGPVSTSHNVLDLAANQRPGPRTTKHAPAQELHNSPVPPIGASSESSSHHQRTSVRERFRGPD